MELKRIIARDSRSANEKAIQLYGPEVLIISSQRVDQQTELIVAVDVPPESSAAPMQMQKVQPTAQGLKRAETTAFKADQDQFLPFAEVFQTVNSQAEPTSDHGESDKTGLKSQPMATAQAVAAPVQSFEERVAANHKAVAGQEAQYEQQRSYEIVDMLRNEMAALRKEFEMSRQMQPWRQTLGLSPDIQNLTLAMQEVGIPAALRSLLTDSIQKIETLDEALPVIQRLLVDAIDRAAVPAPHKGVHALCGPSGAGKTSMLGRLAYAAAMVHGAETQVMISYGDQRPGAWSQIQLLAAQAGVTCFRAADMAMLKTLLDDMNGKTIWVDTPGADFSVHAQQLQSHLKMEIHAVLPVDATVTNVQKILQNQEIRWSSLMLAKVDEAAYPWPLIKGLCEQTLPVSCMAVDAKITVPVSPFAADSLVALAMSPLRDLLPAGHSMDLALQPVKTAKKPRAKKAIATSLEAPTKPRTLKSRDTTVSSAKAIHG